MNGFELLGVELEAGIGHEVPDDIEELIGQAESRQQQLVGEPGSTRVPGFVGSNYRVVYQALRRLAEQRLAAGPLFCEWGSGMGIVTCLASRLGFDALGIEIEPRLVEGARRFAAEFAPAARFVEGSYQPDGLFTETVDASRLDEKLGFSPTAFDLIYVYPWPAEERAALRLFDDYGRERSLLLSFHGATRMRLRQRSASPHRNN
ncbi:hypothetical protein [Piscinibacter sakaiensis]|uniref:hypothetical protein n=1 Tax=Piscinibacter sakaiensis TaxID=1547922 RepID=UPI003AAF45E4